MGHPTFSAFGFRHLLLNFSPLRAPKPSFHICVPPLPTLPALAQVVVGSQRHDFTWLQRVLKQAGVRLTSNELAYDLQSKVGGRGGFGR